MNKLLNNRESFDAIVQALEAAKHLPQGTITVPGLQPHLVVTASKEFKVRLFGASAAKNFVHTEYEPFEDGSVKILLISRPIHPIAMRGIMYSQEREMARA